jgi:dTMP kinase
MTLRPLSDHERGLFISVDGPSGAGKSTVVHRLAHMPWRPARRYTSPPNPQEAPSDGSANN